VLCASPHPLAEGDFGVARAAVTTHSCGMWRGCLVGHWLCREHAWNCPGRRSSADPFPVRHSGFEQHSNAIGQRLRRYGVPFTNPPGGATFREDGFPDTIEEPQSAGTNQPFPHRLAVINTAPDTNP